MNANLAIVLLASVPAAAVGAGVATLTTREAPLDSQAVAPLGGEGDLVALRQEFLSLRDENNALRMRLTAVEERAAAAAALREAVIADVTDADGATQGSAEAAAPGALAAGELPPRFRDSVATALEDIRAEEERDRDDRRREAVEQRLEDRLDELAIELQLEPYQTDQLRGVISTDTVRRGEIMTEARESGDWGSLRDAFSESREETRLAVAEILTSEQMEKYEAMGNDRGFRGFGGGGNGGDGGGRRDRGSF